MSCMDLKQVKERTGFINGEDTTLKSKEDHSVVMGKITP